MDKQRFVRFLYTGCIENYRYTTFNSLSYLNEGREYLPKVIKAIGDESIVDLIQTVAKEDDFHRKDIVLFALAACTSGKPAVSAKAYSIVKEICTTSKNILQFVSYCEQFSQHTKKTTGWGRLRRKTIQQWYQNKRPYDVAFGVTSCQSSDKWSHKDIWRLCHLPVNEASPLGLRILCSYIIFGHDKTFEKYEGKVVEGTDEAKLLKMLSAVKQIKSAESGKEVAKCAIKNKLLFDHLPCQWHNNATMWKHLINYVPLKDLLNNLPRLHNIKILENDSTWQKCVVERILDGESSLHPFVYFWHREKYYHGRHSKQKCRKAPNVEILSALDVAFYSSMKHVKPTGKSIDIIVDLNNPRNHLANSSSHDCAQVTAALCYFYLSTEDHCNVKLYPQNGKDTKITLNKDEDTVGSIKHKLVDQPQTEEELGIDFALPMIHAKSKMKTNDSIDTLIIITNAYHKEQNGKTLPLKAFYQLKKLYPSVRLITIALRSDYIQVNENLDLNILDIVGFDDKVPSLMQSFIMEKF